MISPDAHGVCAGGLSLRGPEAERGTEILGAAKSELGP
jgi:hypothetical protein